MNKIDRHNVQIQQGLVFMLLRGTTLAMNENTVLQQYSGYYLITVTAGLLL